MTYGERYDPLMAITDQVEADSALEKLVQYSMSYGLTRSEAERIEKHNLGYWAGYYDDETRERVERLFRCEHPVFGSIKNNGPPGMLEAFAAGVKRGQELKQEQGHED